MNGNVEKSSHSSAGGSRYAQMVRAELPETLVSDLDSPRVHRHQRFDARDNHERLLAAADAIFAVEGVKAPLDPIAVRAGVGRATLYRHFPTREDLLSALHERLLTAIETYAGTLSGLDDDLIRLLSFYTEQVARRAALVDYWRDLDQSLPALVRARERLLAAIEPAISRAIASGRCRAGITPYDIFVVLYMLTPNPSGCTREERHALGQRALELLTHGFFNPC